MMKKNILIICFTIVYIYLFAQDSVYSKKNWHIEGGTNIFVPLHKYNEVNRNINSYFDVTPKFSISNFYANGIYNYIIHSWEQSFISTEFNLGYLHREIKTIKDGYYSGEGTYFEGKITSIYKKDLFDIGVGINYNYKLSAKMSITNQIRFSSEFIFCEYNKITAKGNFNSETSNKIWGFEEIYFPINYDLGFIYHYKRFFFKGAFEIPLLLINDIVWKNWRDENPPNTIPTSLDKITFLNIKLGIAYKIK